GERERAGQWERVHLSEPGSRESTGGACIRARSAGGRHGEDYTTAQWSAESGGGGRKCGRQCSRGWHFGAWAELCVERGVSKPAHDGSVQQRGGTDADVDSASQSHVWGASLYVECDGQ